MTCLEAKQESSKFYFSKVLLDSGGTRTSIARSSIPSSCKIFKKNEPYVAFTSAGLTNHHDFVLFDQVFLPEFTRTRWLGELELVVFDDHGKSAYDIILGRDLLEHAGLDVMFSSKRVSWDEFSIPFHPRLQPVSIDAQEYPDIIKKAAQDSFHAMSSIKASDYDTKTTGADIAAQQSHLEPEHRTALAAMLAKHDAMFNRVLGKYPDG
jgi:hypothetical protein